MKAILHVMAGLVCIFALSGAALAQTTGGRFVGTVADQNGGVIAGAKVELINEATGIARDTTTNESGNYTFLEIPVGLYTIQVDATGFKQNVQKGIKLQITEVHRVDVVMQIGQKTEQVVVTSEAEVVDTTSTQLGAIVNERSVAGLPLSARDTYQLLQLQPGVQSQTGIDLFFGSDKAGVVSVNGGRGRSNNYSVNGGDGNDLFANLPAVQPSPDAIEEFRVLTNTFDAEYGRNSGAVVNVVTKSGTNDWHGNLFEFFRNKALNARGYLDTIKPDFKQNQYGGTFGGPIKKNKTFFFADFEGSRLIRGKSSPVVTLPSSNELTGNFSGFGQADFNGTLTDPTVANIFVNRPGCLAGLPAASQTTLTNFANGTSTTPPAYSAVFPGAQIPTGCFDPVAVDLLRFLPAANVKGTNNFQGVPNGRDFSDQFSFKIDHEINSKQHLSAYYFFSDDRTLDPFAVFQAAGSNLGKFGGNFATRTQQLNLSHTWTIGNSAVNEFRFSYFREAQAKFNQPVRTNLVTGSCATPAAQKFCFTGVPDTALVDSTGVAIPNANPATATPNHKYGITPNLGAGFEGVPFIQINGGAFIGNNFEGQFQQFGNTFQWTDNYSKVIGKHSMKVGGDFRLQRFDQTLFFDVNGDFTFNSNASAPAGNDLGFADAYPNYLLGLASVYLQGSAQTENVRNQALYLFAQDSWKIKENLTLNYGLRWELTTPMHDLGNRVQVFRPGKTSSIFPCALPMGSPLGPDCNTAGVTPVGLLVPGDTGVPNGLTQTYYKAFGPRIGLAYSPDFKDGFLHTLFGATGKTSIRMGYGMFYNPIEQLVLEQFQGEPPFGVSVTSSNVLFSTPYITQSGSIVPNAANGILKPTRGTAQDWSLFRPILLFGQFQPDMRAQYSEQYNFTIQRELPGNILLQVGYVGSQGHRLLATYDLNHGNAQPCLDLQAVSDFYAPTLPSGMINPNFNQAFNTAYACGPGGEDVAYNLPANSLPSGFTLHLPYGSVPTVSGPAAGMPNNTPITLVGLRQYSSPLCQPTTGAGCPNDGIPIFSNIFTQNTISNSNYNSLQVLVEKHFSHGLQFQGAYTYSKSIDNASSFESSLNPLNFHTSRGVSQFDARQRFVLSYFWELPVPKYSGFAGKLLNGWATSGILTFQSGFPIRIVDNTDDNALLGSFDFEAPDEPDLIAKFKTQDPRKNGNLFFDPAQFAAAGTLGTIGSSPRTLCCGPGINNLDIGFHKMTPINERYRVEFRAEMFNIFNHTQFIGVQGDFSQGGAFGRVLRTQQPRLMQFALKLFF